MRLSQILGALGVAALVCTAAPAAQAQDRPMGHRMHRMMHRDHMMHRDRMMHHQRRMMHHERMMMRHHRMMRHRAT